MLGRLRSLFASLSSRDSGDLGERAAAEWLQRERGFRIVTRNWRNPHDRREELDLVARDGEVLVFVEVKTRDASALVPGYFAVDARKKRVLRRGARAYLLQLSHRPTTYRFDVIEVALPAAGERGLIVRHFENVPLFPKHFVGR